LQVEPASDQMTRFDLAQQRANAGIAVQRLDTSWMVPPQGSSNRRASSPIIYRPRAQPCPGAASIRSSSMQPPDTEPTTDHRREQPAWHLRAAANSPGPDDREQQDLPSFNLIALRFRTSRSTLSMITSCLIALVSPRTGHLPECTTTHDRDDEHQRHIPPTCARERAPGVATAVAGTPTAPLCRELRADREESSVLSRGAVNRREPICA
jgi:hypothetical protein